MRRKKITALAACMLLGAALLTGCGEEEPVPSGTGETTEASQEQNSSTAPVETTPTEPPETEPAATTPTEPGKTEPTETEPEETTPTEPTETEPGESTPTEPTETEPGETTPAEPTETKPGESTPTEPTETEPEETAPAEPTETRPGVTTPTEPTETQPAETTPRQDVCSVETIYGELHFQEQWSPYMQIQQEQEGDILRVYFLARLNETDYPLFDLTISPDPGADGQPELTDHLGAKHGVEVNMEESMEHEELDSSGQEILYSMQEQVNFIIENLT